MPETREEQILNALLMEIAGEDALIEAPREIEQQVLTCWDAPRLRGTTRRTHSVAVVLAASLLVLLVLSRSPGPAPEPRETPSPQVQQTIPPPVPLAEQVAAPRDTAIAASPKRAIAADPAKRPAASEPKREALKFVPLVPMAEQELTGPFQLVRVQLSRAAFADFGAPFDLNRPADPIEADVLLGEDGVARAIRFTNDSTGVPRAPGGRDAGPNLEQSHPRH